MGEFENTGEESNLRVGVETGNRVPATTRPQEEPATYQSYQEPAKPATQVIKVVVADQVDPDEEPQEKIKIKDLHNYQFGEPKNLKYKVVNHVGTLPVEKCPLIDFDLSPDPKLGKKLKELETAKGMSLTLKLVSLAGTTPALWDLLRNGIGTGLSKGTMDIIYRLGIGIATGIDSLLDNIAIAVGSLARRVQIVDLIQKEMMANDYRRVLSIAGGSCILPLEGIFQSGKRNIKLLNFDFSDRAGAKAEKNLEIANKISGDRGLNLEFRQADVINEGLPLNIDNQKELIECTGFWEYLNPEDREHLLESVNNRMTTDSKFVLTALVDNPQQGMFDNMGFKKLHPHRLEEFVSFVARYFDVERIALVPNATYATLVLRKKT